jgi:hypothetical protein
MKTKNNQKTLAVTLIVFAIILSLLSAYFFKNGVASYIERLYYVTQIISSFFMIAGVVIALWQYYLSQANMRSDLELAQVQRAIDLSEYYKDNILEYYPAIRYVFDKSGIMNILGALDNGKMYDFDQQELGSIFSKADIDKLQNLQNSDAFYSAVVDANNIYGLNLRFSHNGPPTQNEDSSITFCIDKRSILLAFMSDLLNDVLNNLEFFALHFKHQTADESVVYQSLHKSYLEMIPVLYYYIAKNNNNSSDKLYTNVIWLYNKWSDEKAKQNANRSEKSKLVQREGTIVQNN